MLTRTAILMIVAFFALNGAVAHANVSPALELERAYGDRVLQQLINESVDRQLCVLEGVRGDDGTKATSLGASFANGYATDTCGLPAPLPDAFQNVAYTL